MPRGRNSRRRIADHDDWRRKVVRPHAQRRHFCERVGGGNGGIAEDAVFRRRGNDEAGTVHAGIAGGSRARTAPRERSLDVRVHSRQNRLIHNCEGLLVMGEGRRDELRCDGSLVTLLL